MIKSNSCKNVPLRSRVSARGYTLMELLVSVAIVGIITAVAAPAFSAMASRFDLNKTTESLTSTLQQARAQAIKFRVPVTIAPKGGNWENGWDSIVDMSQVGLTENDNVLISSVTLDVNSTLTASGATAITFRPSGIQDGFPADGFTVTSPNHADSNKITMTRLGRVSVAEVL